MLGLALTLAVLARATDQEPALTLGESLKLMAQARKCNERYVQMYGAGRPDEALKEGQQLLGILQRLYTKSRYPDGHPQIAASLNNVATALQAMGSSEPALGYFEQALAMYRRLYPASKYPDGHRHIAVGLNNVGYVFGQMGRLDSQLEYYQQALTMRRRLYPESKYPDGHPDIADSLNNLGSVFNAMGRQELALQYLEQALAMCQRVYPQSKYPDGHPDIAGSLDNLGSVLDEMGRHESALDHKEQALAMRRRLYPESKYPNGHFDLATSLNNVGFTLRAMGRYESALRYFQQALTTDQRFYPQSNYPKGHPDLAGSLGNLGAILNSMGQPGSALRYYEQALAMRRRLYPLDRYPDGHFDVAASLTNMGSVLDDMGRPSSALVYFEQVLAMYGRLYPESKYQAGHPDLARALNNIAYVLAELGRLDAQNYYEQALTMRRRLYPESKYPDGHPDIADSLNNLGSVFNAMGRQELALQYLEQALAMRRRLYPQSKYPDGHPDIAGTLRNLGSVLTGIGRHESALEYQEQALAMCRRLYPESQYPNGHPELAASIHNVAVVLQSMGRVESALSYFEQALAKFTKLGQTFGDQVTESEAFSFHRTLPRALDGVLSTSQALPDLSERAWHQVWTSRAAVARLAEARHDALATVELAAPDRKQLEALLGTRRLLARQLLQPLPIEPKARIERDRRVRELTEARERLERELAHKIATLGERQERDRIGPAVLEQALSPRVAYIELLRYTLVGYDPKKPGDARWTTTPHYVAFVVRPGQPVRRDELGPAGPIEEALADWRYAIAQRRDSPATKTLRRLVWEPIAPHLAPDTRVVYLVPDGALARLPWAALPGIKPGTVLLEELQIAVVPHGPFLVQHLRSVKEAESTDAAMLLVGGVRYDEAPTTIDKPKEGLLALNRGPARDGSATFWEFLKGSERELRLVCRLAGPQAMEVIGAEASTTRLLRELPNARRAHVATHGFFNEKDFQVEQRRAAEAVQSWQFSQDKPVGLGGAGDGALSPLSYTGLVLAGANHPEQAGPDGGILTGEMLLGLDLRRMELAVLSACQTGLGAVADGQCVQNLQRAFHVAGCRNVVASLWSVPDESTAALMAVFYEELLRNHKPPLEALRAAQLFIYRHPGRIKELAERGAPLLDHATNLAGSATEAKGGARPRPAAEADRRAAAKDWAGFVLSGPGR